MVHTCPIDTSLVDTVVSEISTSDTLVQSTYTPAHYNGDTVARRFGTCVNNSLVQFL
jgi:hypothetical protein